jgi:hypothetical protein
MLMMDDGDERRMLMMDDGDGPMDDGDECRMVMGQWMMVMVVDE